MAKVKQTSSSQKKAQSLSVVNPKAAGIDIGDKIHAVAVAPDICDDPVRTFGTMTCDLEAIAQWLKECKVNTVALESTGVYWKPLFSLLVRKGFEVFLVNARNVKNVSGRKTDESDASWLQRLHSYGLLSSSYLPSDEQEALRTLVRFRKTLQTEASRCILRMQKSLELMNVKLHTVISDIVGQTGSAIVEAILQGERNAVNLLSLVGKRIKASKEVIEKSLQGNWREEHLFTLGECFGLYKEYQRRIFVCDQKIEEQLRIYEVIRNEGVVTRSIEETDHPQYPKPKYKCKNNPRFNVRAYLHRILKVDVLAIYGLNDTGGLQLLAETGTDLSKWPTEKHFVSWLNLCPNNKISGGKLISSRLMKKQPSVAGQAFRQAANAVQKSDHWLGDYFRRMKAKGGNKYAIVATANKLATIYYKMVRYKTEFNPPLLDQYQKRNNELKIKRLEKRLEQLKAIVV
ncbi:IS110 family transposase [Chitinophaga sp. S165]|uniref:IS110 family transposase n=1 Tax=Chitinophaga sp. S165 TaxID=2135462 RepID=UPI000D7177B9|nr:IS110 family transposase [Chitinophaga sp. S165]PWV44254.1 transposase IS116/IS110/IS902 family protein [Chitinophaga sp. S165]